MFRKLEKVKPQTVYLGTISIAPRDDFKSVLDGGEGDSTIAEFKRILGEIFEFAPTVESNHKDLDLCLDLMVPHFQFGFPQTANNLSAPFPFFWRPAVKLSARLYYLSTEKTYENFNVVERMQWGEFLSKVFSEKSLIYRKPVFGSHDLENLLILASYELLKRIKKVL